MRPHPALERDMLCPSYTQNFFFTKNVFFYEKLIFVPKLFFLLKKCFLPKIIFLKNFFTNTIVEKSKKNNILSLVKIDF